MQKAEPLRCLALRTRGGTVCNILHVVLYSVYLHANEGEIREWEEREGEKVNDIEFLGGGGGG